MFFKKAHQMVLFLNNSFENVTRKWHTVPQLILQYIKHIPNLISVISLPIIKINVISSTD